MLLLLETGKRLTSLGTIALRAGPPQAIMFFVPNYASSLRPVLKALWIIMNDNKYMKILFLLTFLLVASCSEEDQKLAVIISSLTNDGETIPQVVGHFTYESNGVEYKDDINFDGVGAKNVIGSSINEVFVQKKSGTGSYLIVILENSEPIFKTEMSTSSAPITYIKP
jgi:hypothetical protein